MANLIPILMLLSLSSCAPKTSQLFIAPCPCAASQLRCSPDVEDGFFDCICPDGTKWQWKINQSWLKKAQR